ncbi:MAG: SDR family oxidoreductase, partial [Planctomycetota bacterium]
MPENTDSPNAKSPGIAASSPVEPFEIAKNLKGTVALVTGGGRGIGRGICRQLARAGANIVVNYLDDVEDAGETIRQCQTMGADAHAISADVSNRDAVNQMVHDAVAHFGRLDTVVSNAAYSDRELFLDCNLEGFQRTIDVTMWGPFHLLRAAARHMVDAGETGKPKNVIVISSPHAHMAIPGAMAYNMAKAANDQMAKTAAVELAQHDIRVNLIHPGWIDTPGERKFFAEETLRKEGAKLPAG